MTAAIVIVAIVKVFSLSLLRENSVASADPVRVENDLVGDNRCIFMVDDKEVFCCVVDPLQKRGSDVSLLLPLN